MKVPDDFHVYTTKGRIEQEKKQAMKDLLLSIPVEEQFYEELGQHRYKTEGYNQAKRELKQWVDEKMKELG